MSDEGRRPTYRERRLAKADRYEEWAEKRAAKSDAAINRAHQLGDMIPMGQPVIAGHHSANRHRSHLKKIRGAYDKSWEHADKAKSMAGKAATIRAQADRAIYDDDPDAIDRLREKLADLEAQRNGIREYNKTCRKGSPDRSLLHPVQLQRLEGAEARNDLVFHVNADMSFDSYVAANLGGVISSTRKRIQKLEAARAEVKA